MPQVSDQGLDVSQEEQRYLRRTFRRFALPYVAALAVFAWAVSWMSGGSGSPPALDEIEQELAGAKASIEELAGRVDAAAEQAQQAGKRVAALSSRSRGASGADLEALQSELHRATRRIAALESRLKTEGANERIDAISDRVGRVERRLESLAANGGANGSTPAPSPAARSDVPPASPTDVP